MHVRDATVGPLSATTRRIGLRDFNVLIWNAERVGDDLRVHGARALSDLRAAHGDSNAGRS